MVQRDPSVRYRALKDRSPPLRERLKPKEPTRTDLFKEVSDCFESEEDMLDFLSFVSENFECPFISIADNGIGFIIGTTQGDKAGVMRGVSIRSTNGTSEQPIALPSGDPSYVMAVASAVTGLKILKRLEKLGAEAARKPRVEGSPWWGGIIVVTGRYPSKVEEAVFKEAAHKYNSLPCLVFADADPVGLGAAFKLISGSDVGPAVTHAKWQFEAQDTILRTMTEPGNTIDPRSLSCLSYLDTPARQGLLERWLQLGISDTAVVVGREVGEAEEKALLPLGDTARLIEKAKTGVPLHCWSHKILFLMLKPTVEKHRLHSAVFRSRS